MFRERSAIVSGLASAARFWDMSAFRGQEYSKSEIVAAGRVLGCTHSYATDPRDIDQEIVDAFRIAHAWRGAHVVPMRNIRAELYWANRSNGIAAVTAARLKRMRSIRKKLSRSPLTLYQIQDIGGCRAIVSSIADLEKLLALYRNGHSRHRVSREDGYVEAPRPTGYRSHHLRLKFIGEGENEIYNRQTIELQLRTRLQHAWATAVEAVGLGPRLIKSTRR
jgi:ppGpp synthetase/RelA/SpoT-type nucleotidyltranferase